MLFVQGFRSRVSRVTFASVASIVALAACAGCGSSSPPSKPAPTELRSDALREPPANVPQATLGAAVTANNAFAFDLYGRLAATSPTGNLLTSPVSASIALTMTYAGAKGTTATQLATALHFDPAGPSIFDGQNALTDALAQRGPVALETAQASNVSNPSASDYALQVVNSLWAQAGLALAPPFLDRLAKSYGAGVYTEDFVGQPGAASAAIDAWVSDATDGMIQNLLTADQVQGQALVLVDAAHLKFPWQTPFDPSQTAPAPFQTAAGASVTASFMNETLTVPYADDGQAQIVSLPFYGGQVAAIVSLPHVGVDLGAYEAGLKAVAVPPSLAQVILSLPRVSFTSPPFSLASALSAMGATQAFTLSADLSGMVTDPNAMLYVSDVVQKDSIAMQEDGAEAAAATEVSVAATAGAFVSTPPVSMVVNRPYLVTIVDVPTGAILFLGHIVDPTAATSP